MQTISSYYDDKKAKAKAESESGLAGLFKVLGGGLMGFLTGGPMGAVIGAGTGLLGAAIGGKANIPVKDAQSALDKFNAWREGQYQSSSTPTYDSNTGWNTYFGPGRM